MIRTYLAAVLLTLPLAGLAASAVPLEDSASMLAAKQVLHDLSGDKGKKSIRGDTALWTDVVVQKPAENSAFTSLELDLKSTDVDGQLREAGFKLMAPNKRSLAVGLRPTLVLMVLRAPAGSLGNDKAFYLVMANAVQDATPLGGVTQSMTTWTKAGEPILSSGDDHKDIDAIRLSARACVKSFILAAQDKEEPAKP